MKSIARTFALATLAVTASLTVAHAQTQVVRVNVPFDFNLGSEHFAAGTYTIATEGSDIVSVRSEARPSQCMALIESRSDSGSSNNRATVTFSKYGKAYFLAAYARQGETIKLVESDRERSLSREYAMSHMTPDLVTLAMNQPSGR